MMDEYILKDGVPVKEPDIMKWAMWFENSNSDRRVAKTELDNDVTVSTVFLAIDHSFMGGPPLLYETMVFEGELDGEMERYSTLEEAQCGHDAMVKRVKDANRACDIG